MRILNLQNTILVSLLVAGAAATAACGSSDATDRGTAGAGNTSSGGSGNSTSAGGTGNSSSTAGTTSSSTGGTASGTAGTGSGTAGTSAGGSAPSVCDGAASRVLTNTPADAFIDDFEKEQTNTTTNMLDPAAVSPAWYGFNDITPPNSVQAVRTAGGAINTGFFGHYAGTGAKTPVAGGYGVGLEINVGVDKSIPQYCVDASVFTGVSFWAKAASSTNAKISAGFVTPQQNQVMNNGDCPDATPTACNNYPQKDFTLTTDWQQYTVDFATTVSSKGQKVLNGKIQQILWLAPTADWDFSVDEVAFYSGTTAPTTPVAPPSDGSGGTGAGGSSAGGTGGSQ